MTNPPSWTRRARRWLLCATLLLAGLFGTAQCLLWANFDETLRNVTPGDGWVAFERCIDTFFPADRDTYLYLARSLDDRSTWVHLAGADLHVDGPMRWVGPRHLRVPAWFRPGCVEGVDDVTIEWWR